MIKYRKKPVIVEALQVPIPGKTEKEYSDDYFFQIGQIGVWMLMNCTSKWKMTEDKGIDIETLEGVMHASPGDYIIRGVMNEFYPCKPDIFEATYERV